MGENFFQNTAQLGNILYGTTFFPLNVARCCGGANLAVKTLRWRNDLKGAARRGGAAGAN